MHNCQASLSLSGCLVCCSIKVLKCYLPILDYILWKILHTSLQLVQDVAEHCIELPLKPFNLCMAACCSHSTLGILRTLSIQAEIERLGSSIQCSVSSWTELIQDFSYFSDKYCATKKSNHAMLVQSSVVSGFENILKCIHRCLVDGC